MVGPLSAALAQLLWELQPYGVPLQPLIAALRRLAQWQPHCLELYATSFGSMATTARTSFWLDVLRLQRFELTMSCKNRFIATRMLLQALQIARGCCPSSEHPTRHLLMGTPKYQVQPQFLTCTSLHEALFALEYNLTRCTDCRLETAGFCAADDLASSRGVR